MCRVYRYSNNDSLKRVCNRCVYGSVCQLKFPKVVLARISDEVDTLCTVLLSVYSRTRLPIFIEIDPYLTDTEQNKSWHVFLLRHGVCLPCTIALDYLSSFEVVFLSKKIR